MRDIGSGGSNGSLTWPCRDASVDRMRLFLSSISLLALSLSGAGEWLYYKQYPWVYDNYSKDWLYLRGSSDGKIYAHRSSTSEWGEFDANQTLPSFENKSQLPIKLNSTVNLEMIWVDPGTFTMGNPQNEGQRLVDETQRQVTITNGFYFSKFETTNAQWEAVMNGNSYGLTTTPSVKVKLPNTDYADYPVENVSWESVNKFLIVLNNLDSSIPSGWSFKLPTEAEWEYACRSGTTTAFSWGD